MTHAVGVGVGVGTRCCGEEEHGLRGFPGVEASEGC